MTKLGVAPHVAPSARVEESELGRYTAIGERTQFLRSSLGDYSYITEDGNVALSSIGKFCSIAQNVRINASNHPVWRASQHHFTYRSDDYFEGAEADEALFSWRAENAVTIGHDVWIGHGAIILPGVTVGTGAVIAAGAVVSRAVGAYEVAAGVPARVIKRRFDPETAARLAALAWWDWPHAALAAALADFRALSVTEFLDRYEKAPPV
ncbi:DapH/DapD/GlmU-related protein [Afifella sp. IM 167]|uniref:DapH/DapD/GlmU-related protein n=1 Tax=Afifella sp. IM 167 TaxID=2033586 RepID=UPI001CCC1406|nr:DapH/DapD/GlmU-related protein [Afifella sp. IM 167]MBZ8132025.1 hypothetical protein [Afifella sp. IM 167]